MADKPYKPGNKQRGQNTGEAAWARLKASARPLAQARKNRYVPLAETVGERKAAKPAAKKTKPTKTDLARADTAPLPRPKTGAVKIPPAGLESKAKRRLSRGHIAIEARLDLHGLTLAEAHRSLIGFVSGAVAQEKKWLLVITGKGLRGEGKLRRALPEWLAAAPLVGQIAEYGPAAANHGGEGAFYLRIKARARP